MNDQTPLVSQQGLIRPAIVAGWMYVPYEAMLGPKGIGHEKARLTHKLKNAEPGDPQHLYLYQDIPSERYLGVPRAYGMERFSWIVKDDRRTLGEAIPPTPKRPDPNHPAVKEPEKQAAFIANLKAASHHYGSFMAMAATGSGKTVCGLDAAAEVGRKTLVLVHLERLRDQWLDEIKDKLGVPENRIGIVQGDVCEYQNRDFVVGMMPSLSLRFDYPPEFYASFGTVLIDECHRVGAPLLSRCVPLFPAYYRWAVSATPKRKDGNDKVAFWHVGPIRVTSDAKALECDVYVKRYHKAGGYWSDNPLQRPKELSYDPVRNQIIVDLIRRNHAVGRNMLVIGKYVDHLEKLMAMCAAAGVPAEHMGQFTGERNQPIIERDPATGIETVTGTKKVKVKREEYDRIKAESQIIFATYMMFKEGIDVPRLDCGIDVLPQSEATQVIGRIRRPGSNKPKPYWITIVDETCSFSYKLFNQRLAEYRATGCRIVESPRL